MRRLIRQTCLAAGFTALATGTYLATAHQAETALRDRLMAEASRHGLAASIGRVSVQPLTGRVAIEGVRAARGTVRMQIGRVTTQAAPILSLVGAAQAQQLRNFTMDDVEISGALGTLSAEELVVEGANLDEDALQDLIDSDTAKEIIDGLKGLSFKSVKSPEMIFELAGAGAQGTQTLTDVVFDTMRNGRIDKLTAASVAFESKPAKGPTVRGTTGTYEARGLDTVLMARLMADKAAPGEALATAYEFSRLENYKITVDGVADYAIGRVETGAVRLRPLSVPLSEIIAKMPAEGQPRLAPEETKRLIPALLEIFDNISDDGMEIRDMKVTPSGLPGGAAINRISFSFGGGKVPAGMRIEGMDVTGPGVSVKLASLGSEGYSMKPTLEAAVKAIMADDPDLKKVDPRTMIPRLGTTTLRGLEFDVPDPKSVPGKPGRLAGGLGLFEFAAKDEIGGIPTNLSFTVDKLALKLPAETNDAGLLQLKALGYEAVDFASKGALRWDETSREIRLSELSLTGAGMGSVKHTLTVGNVPREVFAADLAGAQIAAMGATLKAKTVRIENAGLAERLLAMQAKAQGSTPDQIRTELGGMAQMIIPALLGPSDDARAIASAVSGFIARLKTLNIEAEAKDSAGVGLASLVTIKNPPQVMELFRFKASAD